MGDYLTEQQHTRDPKRKPSTTIPIDHSNERNSTDIPRIPVIPVHPDDWQDSRPTHNLNETITKTDWWKAVSFLELEYRKRPVDYTCKNVTKRSNYEVCYDEQFKLGKPCLVYSFGIANDFSFDDEMATIDGCEVHSFDPSMGVKDHVRKSSVHFHNIGIGGVVIENLDARRDIYVTEQQTWMVMTLKTIMAALGHADRDIDVLKIDVEGSEWDVVEYLLENGMLPRIKQFLTEWHIFSNWPHRSKNPKNLELFRRIQQAGFKKFSSYMHTLIHNPEWVHLQADTFYVNTLYNSSRRH
ncbi:methyltransferase-like protein 24 [Pecten maximus]|uniref:methyltransferase-like protein 24 n=1 Tax=Pecten maximus TaxID=6579 RepID=UPI001458CE5C|nr:methyltransferase-like protein 24 [Pecten maximus]